MSAYAEMVESFDRLNYMIKTTAPHLLGASDELKTNIKSALVEAKGENSKPAVQEAKAPIIPPPPK